MTHRNPFLKLALAIVVVAVLHPATASAQIARVFLSVNGNDLNICTDTSTPCRSLQEVVNQCPVNGEVIVMNSGGFGTATINKSLTINAPAGVVAFNARTINVNIGPADKVVIRGLSMNGTIFGDPAGINFLTGGTLIVENCLLTGFVNGIRQSLGGSRLVVNNCEFRENSNDGINSSATPAVLTYLTVENCRFEDNGNAGVDTFDYVRAVVRLSVATGNDKGYALNCAVESATGFTTMMLDDVVASHNKLAGIYLNSPGQAAPTIRVTRSTVAGNGTGLMKTGGGLITSYGTNQVWSNTVDGVFTSTVPTI